MRALWGGAQDAFQGWWRTPTLGVGHWPEWALVGQRLGEAWGECWSGGPKALLGNREKDANMKTEQRTPLAFRGRTKRRGRCHATWAAGRNPSVRPGSLIGCERSRVVRTLAGDHLITRDLVRSALRDARAASLRERPPS